MVQGHTLRWLVEVFVQDAKSHAGWSQLTQQPGEEGARRSVILSLRVDHGLFFHPDQHAQLKQNLPASTVGSLRTHVQVNCLVPVITNVLSSHDLPGPRHHFTHALHDRFVFGQAKNHKIQRPWGGLEPIVVDTI